MLTDDNTPIGKVMFEDVISVPPDEKEDDVVADIFKYNLTAMPVVDEDGTILGIITTDDAWDAIEEDATEKPKLGYVVGVCVAVLGVLALYTFFLLQILGYPW